MSIERSLKKVNFLGCMYDTLALDGCALFTRLYHSAGRCILYSVPKPSGFLLSYCLASWFILLCVPCCFLSEYSTSHSYWFEFNLVDSIAFPQSVKILNSIPALQVSKSTFVPSNLLIHEFYNCIIYSIITQRRTILMCIVSQCA